MPVVDVIAIFALTVWACTVTGSPLGRFYHFLKFIRIGNRPVNSLTTLWKSIVELAKTTSLDRQAPGLRLWEDRRHIAAKNLV
jgi:hypothetical protein